MRMVTLDAVNTSMKLAKPIVDERGRILLGAGVELNEGYVDKLKSMGLETLYVDDAISKDITVVETVSDKTRLNAQVVAKEVMATLQLGKSFNNKKVLEVVDHVIDEVISNRKMLFCLNEVRTKETKRFNHSVSVCVLSTMMGLGLGYNQLKLKQLGVGALLHDVGIAKVETEIMKKFEQRDMTPAEYLEYKRHTSHGFQALRAEGELSILSSHVAFQHHEHVDGTGFPRGIKSSEITDYAKIVAICNRFDNLVYGNGEDKRQIHEAVQVIKNEAGTRFDETLVMAFIKYIAIYPVGTTVKLNNGSCAIVTEVQKEFTHRPSVKLLAKDDLGWKETETIIDLVGKDDLFVAEVVEI